MILIIFFALSISITCYTFKKEIFGINENKEEIIDTNPFQKIVKVFSIIDEGVLMSMLKSAEIETKSDSTNFQRIQYGTLLSCYYGINIFVKNEDINDAKKIIIEFINNKKVMLKNQDKAKKTISTLFFQPVLHRELPELLI